jgi:peptide/nickel transport system permease protein
MTKAKGVSRRRLVWNHAARNAMLPVVGFVGWQFGTMLAGSVLVENVFGWPGMGQLAVTAVSQRDLPLVEGITLTFAAIVCLINTGSNMLCELIDPRLRGA